MITVYYLFQKDPGSAGAGKTRYQRLSLGLLVSSAPHNLPAIHDLDSIWQNM